MTKNNKARTYCEVAERAAKMVLLKKAGHSYHKIKAMMGYKDHTTILYHVRRHETRYQYEQRYREIFDRVFDGEKTNEKK